MAPTCCTGGTELVLKYKCGAAPEVAHFYVWLYADSQMAKPLEAWQVGVLVGGLKN